jgi:hypothetical protein
MALGTELAMCPQEVLVRVLGLCGDKGRGTCDGPDLAWLGGPLCGQHEWELRTSCSIQGRWRRGVLGQVVAPKSMIRGPIPVPQSVLWKRILFRFLVKWEI